MRKSRFTEAQIIGMIKEQGRRTATTEWRRPRSVVGTGSVRPCSTDEGQYGGMDTSGTQKLKGLLADTMLDNVVLKDLLGRS